MITQKQFVAHSGLSKGQVSKLVARGMPLTSLDEADTWRGMTAKRPHKPRPAPPVDAGAVQEAIAKAGEPPPAQPPAAPQNDATPGLVTADTPEGAYERQRQIERAAFALAVKALRDKQPDAGRLVQIHSAAARNLTEARAAVLNLGEREGRLLHADWVRRLVLDHDGAIVAIAKTMPRRLAGRLCPEDPERAEAELHRWVEEDFLRVMYQTTPWTRS